MPPNLPNQPRPPSQQQQQQQLKLSQPGLQPRPPQNNNNTMRNVSGVDAIDLLESELGPFFFHLFFSSSLYLYHTHTRTHNTCGTYTMHSHIR